jgi:glycosyltransferase involved in cell wall biosynthesis
MRVLHVSDVMGGGVESAILAMVEATPELDNHLLHRTPSGHDTGARLGESFGSVHELPGNPVGAVRLIRRLTRELFPDVVHAHSSLGGVLVRLAAVQPARVVYSPHCFAFDRRDIGPFERAAFRAVERRLVPRTDLVLAVAPHEVDQAVALGHGRVACALNRAAVPALAARHRTPLEVVTAGRVSAQKDWRFLLHLKRYAERQLGIRAAWTWLGGGEPADERALAAAGVRVTGWIGRDELLGRLAEAQVYVHTAAWEASPVSVLEAAAVGLPLALRSIPALDSLALPGRRTGVVELAERIGALQSGDEWSRAHRESLAVAHSSSAAVQGTQLSRAYDRACGRPPVATRAAAVPSPAALGGARSPRIPAQVRGPAGERAHS